MTLSNSSPETVVREIGVEATVVLGHRAYYGRTCGDGFAVVSQEGEVTVVDRRLQVVRQFDLGGPVSDFSVTPDGTSWAWVTSEQLWIGDPVGSEQVSAPLPGETACRWLPSGQGLWTASGTGDEVRVEIRMPDIRAARSVTVPDKFGGSMVTLYPHPHADAVVLWVAAGQDGQQSWLIRDDSTALTAEHLPADDCLPALFGPDGTWMLTADDDRITRRSWPGSAELGSLNWADIDPAAVEDDSDMPGSDLALLPGGFVSWSTGNGRLRTIDLSTMSVVDEIALAGHPVRTVAELYPTLADDHNLCGDFGYSVLGTDDMMLSVHKQNTLVLSALRDWSPAS